MPHIVCSRCQRANPAEAFYCHFDGAELRSAGGRAGPGTLPHEFVFSSGRRCRTFDELVQGCQYEWEDARLLLHKGVFAQFMASIGRMDLVRAAREAQGNPDPDIGLHSFVSALPVAQVQGPRLELSPRRLVLGAFRAGETRQVLLTVSNGGKGLLQGKLTISEGSGWLRLAEGDPRQCALKTAREQQVSLQIDTHGLASPRSYSGKLTVITNGGIVEVPVRLDVTAHPFPRPPFQGIGSPREMAEQMKIQPKQAVPLLESGDIARWFAANGWTYPVQGPTAKGVAAVQQFFEGMGLSRPPVVAPVEPEMRFVCVPPEVAPGQVVLRSAARKWVYAQADSDVPWLRVTTPSVSGPQQALVGFEIDSTLMDEGRLHEGYIHLVANAGQRLEVRVVVDVHRPQVPFTRRLLRPFFAWALLALLYRLLLALPADVIARPLTAAEGAPRSVGAVTAWAQPPALELGFVKYFALVTWWLGAVGGGLWLWRRGGRASDVLGGIVAGGVAGLMASVTLACLLPTLDGAAREVWRLLAHRVGVAGGSPWFWTPVWIAVAAGCWAVLGGLFGLAVGLAGSWGRWLLGWGAAPWTWLFGLCGWKRAAALLAARGA
jgi:hypothetical protein